jgi:hypothetical protein
MISSYNSAIYSFYVKAGLVVLVGLPFMCAMLFSGYGFIGESYIKIEEKRQKYINAVLTVVLLGITIMSMIIFTPYLMDIPEYFGGEGQTVTGTITEFETGSHPQEEKWTRISLKVEDEVTGKIISIKETSFPYVEIGDTFKINYLRYCKMGTVLEVNGMPCSVKRVVNKQIFIIAMVLLHLYFIVRMLLALVEKPKLGKRCSRIHIHKARCIAWIFVMEMINSWITIMLVGVMQGYVNDGIRVGWNILLAVFYIFLFILSMEDYYVLSVNGKNVIYCDRKIKFHCTTTDIKEIVKVGKQYNVILENGMQLPIYDLEEDGYRSRML